MSFDDVRKPFFIKYPIKKVTDKLFALLFLERLHGFSINKEDNNQGWLDELIPIFPESTDQVLADKAALQILSTFAINSFALLSYQGYESINTYYTQLMESCQNTSWDEF